jgi:hypothetical protein
MFWNVVEFRFAVFSLSSIALFGMVDKVLVSELL